MKKLKPLALSAAVTLLTTGSGLAFADATGKSANGFRIHGGDEIMLQMFHWNTVDIQWERWYEDIDRDANADLVKDLGVTMAWMPPPWEDDSTWESDWSDAHNKPMKGGHEGYFWSDFDLDGSRYGSATELANAAQALDSRGIKVIYDMVLNHRDDGRMDYCTTPSDDCWPYNSDNRWAHIGGDEGYANFLGGGPDVSVGNAIDTFKNKMNILRDTYYAKGWRYDYIKGFNPEHMNTLNARTVDDGFCVGEYWVDNPDMGYVVDTLASKSGCTMFDFHTYGAMQAGNMFNVRYGMAAHWNTKYREAAATMIASHDKSWSPEADGNDYSQDLWPLPDYIYDAGMAFILTAPGTPTLYLPDVIVTDNGSGSAKTTWEKGWVYGLAQELIAARKAADVRAWSSITFHGSTGAAYSVEGEKGTLIASIWNDAQSPNAVSSYYNNDDFTLMSSGGWGKIWVEKTAGSGNNGNPGGNGDFSSTYPSMNVRGTMNGWQNEPMVLVGNDLWEATFVMDSGTDPRFKFDVYGNWNTNFGGPKTCSSYPCTGNLTSFAGDIKVAGANEYKVQVDTSGGTYTYSVEIVTAGTVENELPVARAGADNLTVGKNVNVTFQDNGSSDKEDDLAGTALTYEWFIDGSGTAAETGAGPHTKSWSTTGTKTIKLKVTDSDSESHEDTLVINVVDRAPLANAGEDYELKTNKNLTLSASSSDPDGDSMTYSWTCVDASGSSCNSDITNSTSEDPTVNFSTVGDRTLTMSVTSGSLTTTDTVLIRVISEFTVESGYDNMYLRGTHNGWGTLAMNLVADYTWEVEATFTASGNFKFDASGSWTSGQNWGSGSACNGGTNNGVANTSGNIGVNTAGTYTITFNDQTKRWSCMIQDGPETLEPVVANAGSDLTVESGEEFCLSGGASGGITPYTYEWSSSPALTIADGVSPCLTITNDGSSADTYTITLTATDSATTADDDTDTVTITVNEAPDDTGNGGGTVNLAPNAVVYAKHGSNSLAASPMTVDEDVAVTFDGRQSFDPDGAIDTYSWSGDEISGSSSTLTHTFTVPGTYTITLTVADESGLVDVESYEVIVEDAGNDSTTVDIEFTCTNGNTNMGQSVYVVGDLKASGVNQGNEHLGPWSIASIEQKLRPTSYPTWKGTITVPVTAAGEDLYYNCVIGDEKTLNIDSWGSTGDCSIGDTSTTSTTSCGT